MSGVIPEIISSSLTDVPWRSSAAELSWPPGSWEQDGAEQERVETPDYEDQQSVQAEPQRVRAEHGRAPDARSHRILQAPFHRPGNGILR
jgi:hypothetical protein